MTYVKNRRKSVWVCACVGVGQKLLWQGENKKNRKKNARVPLPFKIITKYLLTSKTEGKKIVAKSQTRETRRYPRRIFYVAPLKFSIV